MASIVLCVGLNRSLMNLRVAVFKEAGYNVIEGHKAEEALRLFRSTDVDLAVLCHSIPIAQRRGLASLMKDSKPMTPVLVLHQGFESIIEADASIDNLCGPKTLLEVMASLLHKPGQSVRRS